MKEILTLFILFFSFQAYSSEQVLTCGMAIDDSQISEDCAKGPKGENCENLLPNNQYMVPQFEIWLGVDIEDYSMTYFDDGILNIFGIVFDKFKALRPIEIKDKKLKFAFQVEVTNSFQKSMGPETIGTLLDLDYAGSLENKPGKVYYIGKLKAEPADETVDDLNFACEYK